MQGRSSGVVQNTAYETCMPQFIAPKQHGTCWGTWVEGLVSAARSSMQALCEEAIEQEREDSVGMRCYELGNEVRSQKK